MDYASLIHPTISFFFKDGSQFAGMTYRDVLMSQDDSMDVEGRIVSGTSIEAWMPGAINPL